MQTFDELVAQATSAPIAGWDFSWLASRSTAEGLPWSYSSLVADRILSPGGTFITQQVDFHSYDDLYELLGLDVPQQPETWLPFAQRQLIDAGLKIQLAVRDEEERTQFHDVAAVIYYLRIVAWAIPQFSLDAFMARLRAAHERAGAWPVTLRERRFLLVASKQM
jgi:hypothetical protein